MVQPLSTELEYVDTVVWFRGISTYGKILVNDKGFELYSDNNFNDYVQIPRNEVTVIVADVYFDGKYIPRPETCTKKNGSFISAARHVKPALCVIRKYVPANSMRRAFIIW